MNIRPNFPYHAAPRLCRTLKRAADSTSMPPHRDSRSPSFVIHSKNMFPCLSTTNNPLPPSLAQAPRPLRGRANDYSYSYYAYYYYDKKSPRLLLQRPRIHTRTHTSARSRPSLAAAACAHATSRARARALTACRAELRQKIDNARTCVSAP